MKSENSDQASPKTSRRNGYSSPNRIRSLLSSTTGTYLIANGGSNQILNAHFISIQNNQLDIPSGKFRPLMPAEPSVGPTQHTAAGKSSDPHNKSVRAEIGRSLWGVFGTGNPDIVVLSPYFTVARMKLISGFFLVSKCQNDNRIVSALKTVERYIARIAKGDDELAEFG